MSIIYLDVVGVTVSFYAIISLGSQISIPESVLFLTVTQDGILVLMLYTSVLGKVKGVRL